MRRERHRQPPAARLEQGAQPEDEKDAGEETEGQGGEPQLKERADERLRRVAGVIVDRHPIPNLEVWRVGTDAGLHLPGRLPHRKYGLVGIRPRTLVDVPRRGDDRRRGDVGLFLDGPHGLLIQQDGPDALARIPAPRQEKDEENDEKRP